MSDELAQLNKELEFRIRISLAVTCAVVACIVFNILTFLGGCMGAIIVAYHWGMVYYVRNKHNKLKMGEQDV